MLYKDDVGINIRYQVSNMPTSYVLIGFVVRKPDLSVVTWEGTVDEDKICYTTVANDLDQIGKYCLQPFVTGSGDIMIHGDPKYFIVAKAIGE